MKIFRVILIFTMALFLAGCWDSKEVGDLAIVTGMGIDAGAEKDEIKLVLQVGDMSKGQKDSQGETEPIILDSTGVNIQAAIESLKIQSTRSLYFSHNQVILIGEEQARRGIACFLDWFVRNENTRMEVPLIVAKQNAKAVLQIKTTQNNISAFAVKSMLDNDVAPSFYSKINLLSFLSTHINKTTCPIAPIVVSKIDSDKNTILEIEGTAIFKEGKMIGELGIHQTEGLMWILGQSPKRNIIVKNDDGNAALAIVSSQSSISSDYIDGEFINEVNIKATFRISELAGFKDKHSDNIIPFINDLLKDDMYTKIGSAIQSSKNYKSDIFGFGSALYKKSPEKFEQIVENFDEIYSKSPYRINLEVEVLDTGKINGILTDHQNKG